MSAAPSAEGLLSLCGWSGPEPPNVLVFVAHPDDETIMLGGHLRALPRLTVVHATDGAPRDLKDARAHGFADAESYALQRRKELNEAMRAAGAKPALIGLEIPDQGAARRLVDLTRSFAAALTERRPDIVFTHAYEGGHPDHDAVAFAARAALRLQPSGRAAPLLIEAPLYHRADGVDVRQRFAAGGGPGFVIRLSPDARALKRRMMDAYATQRETLEPFHAEEEWFRRAAACDFSKPPNGGEIHYEGFDWKCSGAEFAALAQAALAELGLAPCL